MNILMMTNTYTPLVGGLERSIQVFAESYRRRGHRVIIAAPAYEKMPAREKDVIRLPAITHLTRSDFSVPLPGILSKALRGVRAPIEVVPTGVELKPNRRGAGLRMREELDIPPASPLIGHVGRLGPEKNPIFLARAAALFLHREPEAHFLLVGEGPSRPEMLEAFRRWGVEGRVHAPGTLQGEALDAAYQAMDLFAFSSKSETQGLVLLEAMAAGVPVVAVKAPGVVDLLRDGWNGRLLERESAEEFAGALAGLARMPRPEREQMRANARARAAEFSTKRCADRALEAYGRLRHCHQVRKPLADSPWARALRWMGGEWRLMKNLTGAALAAVEPP